MFEISKTDNKLEISFSAALKNIDKAAEETKSFLVMINKKEHTFNTVLVMREGLINAVIHGNKCDENKTVMYKLIFENQYLKMNISDEGNGFDWKKMFEKEADSTADCGRGLFIMKTYSSFMEYNQIGNQLLLSLKLI